MTSAIFVLLAVGAPLVLAAIVIAIVVLLGRRAREGRRAGRYTSRPGNSADNGSSGSVGSA